MSSSASTTIPSLKPWSNSNTHHIKQDSIENQTVPKRKSFLRPLSKSRSSNALFSLSSASTQDSSPSPYSSYPLQPSNKVETEKSDWLTTNIIIPPSPQQYQQRDSLDSEVSHLFPTTYQSIDVFNGFSLSMTGNNSSNKDWLEDYYKDYYAASSTASKIFPNTDVGANRNGHSKSATTHRNRRTFHPDQQVQQMQQHQLKEIKIRKTRSMRIGSSNGGSSRLRSPPPPALQPTTEEELPKSTTVPFMNRVRRKLSFHNKDQKALPPIPSMPSTISTAPAAATTRTKQPSSTTQHQQTNHRHSSTLHEYQGYSRQRKNTATNTTTSTSSRHRSFTYSPPPPPTSATTSFTPSKITNPSLINSSAIPPVPPVPKMHTASLTTAATPNVKKRCSSRYSSSLSSSSTSSGGGQPFLDSIPVSTKTATATATATTATTTEGASALAQLDDFDTVQQFLDATFSTHGDYPQRVSLTLTTPSPLASPVTTTEPNSDRLSTLLDFDVHHLDKDLAQLEKDIQLLELQHESIQATLGTKTSTMKGRRKRGQTLPGTLATPPPLPVMPTLPPMTLNPIQLTLPESTTDNGHSSIIEPSLCIEGNDSVSTTRQKSTSTTPFSSSNHRRLSNNSNGSNYVLPPLPAIEVLDTQQQPRKRQSQPQPPVILLNEQQTRLDLAFKEKEQHALDKVAKRNTISGASHNSRRDRKLSFNNTAHTQSIKETVLPKRKSHIPISSTTQKQSINGYHAIRRATSERQPNKKPHPSPLPSPPEQPQRRTDSYSIAQQQQSYLAVRKDEFCSGRAAKGVYTTLKYYSQYLSDFERQIEINDYQDIYFIGPHARKINTTESSFVIDSNGLGSNDDLPHNFGYDDKRGDYKIVLQDHLAYRYEIVEVLGRGSFGQVVKCFDHKLSQWVAIKLIRNKKRFHAQAMTEIHILKKLVEWDPDDQYHTIRMTDYFYFRNHLCIAFECLSMNLYEFIKLNHFQGFSLHLIKRITLQILQSLNMLAKHDVIHCDLKPENIMLKHPSKTSIKVIDFGSSCFESERVYTYIQSRFYRSPEVILGLSYHKAIDMWSLGCIAAELYTGLPLFPGENEQEQLSCIMEMMGVPDRYLIDRSSRRKLFFDSLGRPRIVANSKGKKRLPGTRSLYQALKCCQDIAFIDFIERCLCWDPSKRMTPQEALRHEWMTTHHSHNTSGPTTSVTKYPSIQQLQQQRC